MAGNNYVTIENQGDEIASPDSFRHYNGTRIFWYQDVDNTGSVEEFVLGFNYLYLHGPIGDNYSNIFEFCAEILDGPEVLWAWSADPTNLTERGSWMAVGPIMVNLPYAPPVFELRVNLKVNTPGSYVEIPVDDPDLGGDVTNGQFVSFLLDDVSLTATGMTSCDSVELTASNELAGAVQIAGSEGAGGVSLSFDYWNVAKIPVQITANTTVSFEFSAAVTRMTRFSNSTSSTSPGDQGVSFNVNGNEAVDVWLFTYLESYPEAANLEITVKHPADWSANSVRNSFGTDVTASCVFETGNINVPSGVEGSAGWWRFDLSAPNYMDDVRTEVQGDSEDLWQETSLFRNNDRIRCIASPGMETEPVEYPVEIEINIYLPSGTLWASEVVSPFNSSTAVCTPATLGPVNASIGMWTVTAGWNNGTEVAYGSCVFEVRHRATVFPHTPSVQVEIGGEFTAAVYIYDQDNGNPILAGAEVIGNLSSASVVFSPNLARSWWEATFNTSLLTTGQYVVQVNVSISFYETLPCFISLSIPKADSGFAVAFGAGVAAALAIFLVLLSMTYGRRLYMSVAAKRNLELLEMKGRLDDAKNLIGFLVIQKKIGLPLYSKVLKGAFEESMLSSFISAISHFRDEFSMSEPKWKSIPITEVITAVQTEQLICAIITVDPSSDRTRRRLEEFGRSIGSLYDASDEMSSLRPLTSKNLESVAVVVEPLFEGYFDGGLLAKYVGLRRSIPSRLKPVTEAFSSMQVNHGVSPESVIRSVVLLGYSERTAYRSVLEAVDEGYLIRAKKGLPLPNAVED